MELSNGALIHTTPPPETSRSFDLTVTLTRPQLLQLLATAAKPDGIDISGDPAVLGRPDVSHRRP